jgi:FdrA protein
VAWTPSAFTVPAKDLAERVNALRARLGAGRRRIVGLYSGGTLADEARLILDGVAAAEIVDLGADEYTVGRPHPMLDSNFRVSRMKEAGGSSDLAVLLLDVVLGHGVAADPAGDLADAIASTARSAVVIASVVGTAGDPQGHAAQVDRLEAAGAWVLPSNAQAARAAAMIAERTAWDAVQPEKREALRHAAGSEAPLALDRRDRMAGLLAKDVSVVNIGLEAFALDLASRNVPVVHVAWKPPAGGNLHLAKLLAQLAD